MEPFFEKKKHSATWKIISLKCYDFTVREVKINRYSLYRFNFMLLLRSHDLFQFSFRINGIELIQLPNYGY